MEEILNNGNDVDNGVKSTQNEEPYKVFKTQKDFDDFSAYLIKKTEEKTLKNAKVENDGNVFDAKDYEAKYRKELESKIRADIERQAKMTEQEKLKEQRQLFEQSIKDERTEINKERAKMLLSNAGFEDEEMELYLEFVNDDKDSSLDKISKICDNRKSNQEKLKSKWQQELQKSYPEISSGNKESKGLQGKYDDAKKMQNLPLMSSILREAQAQNITLI